MKVQFTSILSLCFGAYVTNGQVSKVRDFKEPCVVMITEVEYENNLKKDEPLVCELRGKDLNDTPYKIVQIKSLTTSWAVKNNVQSGVTTLFASKSAINDETNELIIPKGQAIELGGATKVTSNSTRRLTTNSFDYMSRKLQSGTRKVLVIRAVASGGVATSASEAALWNDVFVDSVNLKRQVKDCSRQQLILQPAVAPLVGTDGVYTANIPTTIVPISTFFSVLIDMITKATNDLGPLNNIANHVMFCLPPGTTPSTWVSLAFVGSWLSAFNNDWCRSPSAQLRNFGYNINFGFSSGDMSCLMGGALTPFTASSDNFPRKCYNGPKSYQAGWYSPFHVDLPIAGNYNWNGFLVGFAEASSVSASDKMIIRIRGSIQDTYIHFNRQVGMNINVPTNGNKVLVNTRPSGLGYSSSTLVAALDYTILTAGDDYEILNFNGSGMTLTITLLDIIQGSAPWRAKIAIDLS